MPRIAWLPLILTPLDIYKRLPYPRSRARLDSRARAYNLVTIIQIGIRSTPSTTPEAQRIAVIRRYRGDHGENPLSVQKKEKKMHGITIDKRRKYEVVTKGQ